MMGQKKQKDQKAPAGNGGGRSKGGNGGGNSVLPTADDHNETRRAAKARQRHNRGRRGQLGTTCILDEVRNDRLEKRAAQEEQNRQAIVLKVCARFDRRAQRKNWDTEVKANAKIYVEWLAGLRDDAFDVLLTGGLNRQQMAAVEFYFADAIYWARSRRPKGTPGQLADWYDREYAKAEAQAAEKRQAKANASEAAKTPVAV